MGMLQGVEPLSPEERAEHEAKVFPARDRTKSTTESRNGEDADNPDGAEQHEQDYVEEDGEDGGSQGPDMDDEDPLNLEPSCTLRLLGHMSEWNRRTGSGLACGEGYEDIIVHHSALPPEVQGRKSLDFTGCEFTFEIDVADDGKLQARDVHLLLQPDGDGG